MTRELLNRMPKQVVDAIEKYRMECRDGFHEKADVRARLSSYVMGLRDAGMITEYERKVLFVYGTV